MEVKINMLPLIKFILYWNRYTVRSIVCEDPVIMSCYSGIMSPSISNIAKD